MKKTKNIPKNLIRELNEASEKLDDNGQKNSEKSNNKIRILSNTGHRENPFAKGGPTGAKGLKAYSGDYQGAFSLENFASAGALTYTNDDASGWLDYLDNFNPSNFWYKDSNVKIWAYYDQYDNWQDTYGMDACRAIYHSGHGGMTGDGRFHVPLGADWGGQGTTAWSDKMRLGNDQARYIWWSTCYSCRVLGGHSPKKTWDAANKGFRMLFGYETVSYDNPNYGKFFWEEWNKNKSFSKAFLDASWRISHNQAPSVVACGASKDEAIDRVFNERYLYWNAVSKNWWWWRWYNVASSATAARPLNQSLPKELLIAQLAPRVADENFVKDVMMKHNVQIGLPKEVQANPNGNFTFSEGEQRLTFERDGSYEIQLSNPNPDNKNQISLNTATSIANSFVKQHGLDDEELVFDRIMLAHEGGGSENGSGQMEGPYVTGTVVQYTQLINGIPVLGPGKGTVAVTLDNDGKITNIKNSTRSIGRLTDKFRNSPSAPGEDMYNGQMPDPRFLLGEAWQNQMKNWIVKGRMPVQFKIVPGTYEIGYAIKGNEAILVARNDVEVDCGGGYFKRYAMEVPIVQ